MQITEWSVIFNFFKYLFITGHESTVMGAAQAAKLCPTQMQGAMQHPYVTHSGNPLSQAPKSEAVFDDVASKCGHTILDILCMG